MRPLQLISYNFSANVANFVPNFVPNFVVKFILKFTSPYVNKAFDWSLNKNKPIRGFVYIRACEFIMNF